MNDDTREAKLFRNAMEIDFFICTSTSFVSATSSIYF